MSERASEVAVLLADVTGSTPLYEAVGDAQAARRVAGCLAWLRDVVDAGGGFVVSSKGDDILATFERPEAALETAGRIVGGLPAGGLSVHAGLHFGQVIAAGSDIYGDAVNLTARLAGMANAGEVLISGALVARLPAAQAAALRRLNAMPCKGKALPVEVFTLDDETPMRTEVAFVRRPASGPAGAAPGEGVSVELEFEGKERRISEGDVLALGRAPENDIVVSQPWVSRQHATIAVARGRVQLTDRSSYGSYVVDALGCEYVALRETIILTGAGRISLGTSASAAAAPVIGYQIRAGSRP